MQMSVTWVVRGEAGEMQIFCQLSVYVCNSLTSRAAAVVADLLDMLVARTRGGEAVWRRQCRAFN